MAYDSKENKYLTKRRVYTDEGCIWDIGETLFSDELMQFVEIEVNSVYRGRRYST